MHVFQRFPLGAEVGMSIQCPLEQNLSTLAQVSLVIPSPLFMGSDSLEDGPVGPRSRIDAVTSLKSSVCLTQTDVDVGVVGGAFWK